MKIFFIWKIIKKKILTFLITGIGMGLKFVGVLGEDNEIQVSFSMDLELVENVGETTNICKKELCLLFFRFNGFGDSDQPGIRQIGN